MGWQSSSNTLLIITALTGGFSGVFVYSPAPGSGNLIASIAATVGTDPYGNAYLDGITTYSTGAGTTKPFTQDRGGQIFWGDTGSAAQVTLNAVIQLIDPGQTTASPSLQVVSPGTGGLVSGLELLGQSADLSQPAQVRVSPGGLVASAPGNLFPAGIPEVWNTATPGNSWTGTFRYRLSAENEAQLDFSLVAPGAGVNGVTIVTLPAAYRPIANKTFPVGSSGQNAAAGARMTLATTGTCQVADVTANSNPVAAQVKVPLN